MMTRNWVQSVVVATGLLGGLCTAAPAAGVDVEHKDFTQILRKHVVKGVVSYDGIRQDLDALQTYLDRSIVSVTPSQFAALSAADQIAHLVNAYNAYTLRIVADFYPVASIRDIGPKLGKSLIGGSKKQWGVSRYKTPQGVERVLKARGEELSLDDIEHKYLRRDYPEPRVHFVLVCAAISCPILRSEALAGVTLDATLKQAGEEFLADPFRNRFDAKSKTLFLSQIFNWFEKDFTKQSNLASFVRPFLKDDVQAQVSDKTKVKHLEYDWSLNNKAGKVSL